MEYLVINRERTLDAVARRIYKRLPDTLKKQAMEKLLKLNPELKDFKSVNKGFIVIVPPLIDIENKSGKSALSPVTDLIKDLETALKTVDSVIDFKFDAAIDLQNTDLALLEEITKKVKNSEDKKQFKAINSELKKTIKAQAGLKRNFISIEAGLKKSTLKEFNK